MAYNLIYTLNFSNIVESNYTLNIYKKDYIGSATALTGASVPVLHKWDTDEPKAPIKGSSLTVSLLNIDNALPLTAFYSNDDDTFKAEFICNTLAITLFEGFLIQEDAIELMVDYTHEIELSFTDNLGLLKDTTLDKAIGTNTFSISSFKANVGLLASNTLSFAKLNSPVIKAGDKIVITGTAFNGTYTVASAFQSGSSNNITIVEPVANRLVELGTISIRRVITDLEKISLSTILEACLKATNLALPVNIYSNIYETTTDPDIDFLQQTLINRETFIKSGDEFDDCYSVLFSLFARFNITLFQSLGKWQIVRWDEAAYKLPTWRGFNYNADFTLLGTSNFNNLYTAGINELSYAKTGLNRRISRPYEFVKETFDYKNTPLLRNADLSELGALITSYIVQEEVYKPDADVDTTNDYSVTFYEYEMPKWFDNTLSGTVSNYRIRIVKDQYGNELERYAVVKDDACKSTAIEASIGDKVSFSFQIRHGAGAVSVPNTLIFVIELKNGTSTKYADEDGTWKNTFGYNVSSSNTYADWTSVNIETGRIPFDGLLTVYLTLIAADETHYNDMRFEYISYINESTKITGQKHNTKQIDFKIKNNSDTNLTVDDSPRNYISGTLFTQAFNGLIQKRTQFWQGPNLNVTIPTPISCKLYEFSLFGPDTSTYTITGKYCDGSSISINRFVGDGNPGPICAQGGTVVVTGNIIITNQSTDCGTYQPQPETTFRLGRLITYETLQWRNNARTILEGSFRGLIHNSLHVSMLSIFKYTYTENLNYIFGRLEIDYRNDILTATLWELYKSGSLYNNLPNNYNFSYIYTTN